MRRNRFLVLLLIIGAVSFFMLYPGYRRLIYYRGRLETLEKENNVLIQQNKKLAEEIDSLKNDPLSRKKIAREIGIVEEDEVIYEINFIGEDEDESKPEQSEASRD